MRYKNRPNVEINGVNRSDNGEIGEEGPRVGSKYPYLHTVSYTAIEQGRYIWTTQIWVL